MSQDPCCKREERETIIHQCLSAVVLGVNSTNPPGFLYIDDEEVSGYEQKSPRVKGEMRANQG